ncbi:ABC transporter permease subunit [Streptomyces sp. HMX112]|uniref:ABC transporter permease subunit n=1 Tax=Streptomyces sp. HMX112 TaxID=3390850 RepID=UPI003A7FD598
MTTPPAPHQQQSAYTYTSPIPDRRAHLGDALASEWTKIRSVRSTLWTLGVMILLMVGIGVLSAVAVAAADVDLGGEPVLGLGFYGVLLGSICVITLGVLTITSEYGTGMIRTTLTACPSRVRVLTAKAIVFFLLVFVLTTVVAALVAVVQDGMVDGGEASGADWFRATVGVGLYVAALGLLSLAVGALLRHSAGAITLMIAVVLLPIVMAMFMYAEWLQDVRDALLTYSVPSQLITLYGTEVSPSGPSGWEPVWITLGVAGVALAGAFLVLNKRDV